MNTSQKSKGTKETWARFFEEPTRESLRDLIKDNVGETANLDFKQDWPTNDSLAKHILGFANTGPACIVIGMAEKDGVLEPVGLQKFRDKADINNGLKNYLPSELMNQYQVFDFPFEESEYPKLKGKLFQALLIEYNVDHTPFVSMKAGTDIKAPAIYVRREGLTVEASNDELQRILNKRIDAGYSTTKELNLKKHIEQLKLLYAEFPLLLNNRDTIMGMFSPDRFFSTTNPKTPKESLSDFLNRMIEMKKKIIEKQLGAKS